MTGLQFVVIALIAESDMRKETQGIEAFGTPTIVHFSTVLLLSAILSAPWHVLTTVAVTLAAIGVAGLIYSVIVMRRARGQDIYKPVLEDWLWHAIFPLSAHLVLVGSALALFLGNIDALFPIGGVSLFLLFIGIHNAWDSVVFIVVGNPPKAGEKQG
ncbi:MAG: hypothetical protein ACJ78R_02380 [Gemmatimonadaceae bacterium]